MTDHFVAAPDPALLLELLRRHRAAEAELRAYLFGVLDGLGIARADAEGIDDVTGNIILRPPPETKDAR